MRLERQLRDAADGRLRALRWTERTRCRIGLVWYGPVPHYHVPESPNGGTLWQSDRPHTQSPYRRYFIRMVRHFCPLVRRR